MLYAKAWGEKILLLWSAARPYAEAIECAWIAKANGAKVVAITRGGMIQELITAPTLFWALQETGTL